jgi:hypothetical protein
MGRGRLFAPEDGLEVVPEIGGGDDLQKGRVEERRSKRLAGRPAVLCRREYSTTDVKGARNKLCVEPYIARPVAENHHSWLR